MQNFIGESEGRMPLSYLNIKEILETGYEDVR
jgi:hypothetical protein